MAQNLNINNDSSDEDWSPEDCRPKTYGPEEGFYFEEVFHPFSQYSPDIWSQYLKEGKAIYPYFQDLQRNLLPLNKMLHGFLLLDYDPDEVPYLAVIEILNDTSIVQGIQFLKLCTGELGNSYKGIGCYQESGEYSRYRLIGGSHRVLRKKKTSVLRVKSFDFQTKDKYQLFFSGETPLVFTRGMYHSDDRHLFFQNDGSFELHLMPENNVKGICIGKITECKFSNLSLENITILDCGIAFQLPI